MNKTFDELIQKIKAIPKGIIPYTLYEWGIQENDLPQLVEESFTKGRMDNNIVDLTQDDVLDILNYIKWELIILIFNVQYFVGNFQ